MSSSRVCLPARLGLLALFAVGAGCTVVIVPPPAPEPRVRVGPRAPLAPGAEDTTVRPVRRFDEVRALWVVRYTMTSEERVRSMVERAAAANINTLIVQVRGRADAFYRSGLEPRGEAIRGPETFDPLALVIEEAHRHGMAVHAWINTHLVWGPTARPQSPQHVVNAHPDWLAVPHALGKELAGVDPDDRRYFDRLVEHARANGSTVEGLYTSPSHPGVQDRVHAVWMDLARRYDLDGLHFDYIRFPSANYDFSLGALERFRVWVRPSLTEARFRELDNAYDVDLYAFVEGEPALWDGFRRAQIRHLVERIHHDVKALDDRFVVSAAVIADPESAHDDRFQDWPGWLRSGILDVVVPMAYTPDRERFTQLVRAARAAAGSPDRVWAGIGAYMNTPSSTMEMIDIARREGAGGVALFSYDWAVGQGQGDPADPLLERIGRARFAR